MEKEYNVSLQVMQHLVIDIGNARIKYAVVDKGEIGATGNLPHDRASEILKIVKQEKGIRRGIVASVAAAEPGWLKELEKALDLFIVLDGTIPLPFRVLYRTPETLGPDRLAAVAGAYTKFPGSNVMIFDLGTALTVDILNASGEYVGGNISPGMSMRFRALHQFTGRLPLGEPENGAPPVGGNTQEALTAGVQQGILREIEGYITWGRSQFTDMKVILTGGDADFFAKMLKSPIFVDRNLVFTGLDRILQHYAEHTQD
ncbi:MAG TPA: type III pantothenate kinase [Bacteroidetes bacterium]|nr:type III pantothenate kinase [Bacteroidota bacterium]